MLLVKGINGLNHYVIINSFHNSRFEVFDPANKLKKELSAEQLKKISLNVVGVLRNENNRAEKKKRKTNNKFYLKQWLQIIKKEWLTLSLLNVLDLINLFSFFLTGMFIKVMFNEYMYLSINRMIIIVSLFIAIGLIWFSSNKIYQLLINKFQRRYLINYFKNLNNKYDLLKVDKAFTKQQIYKETSSLINVIKNKIFILTNLISFILFTIVTVYLTYKISSYLLLGTLIIMLIFSCLKFRQAKKNYDLNIKNILNNKTTNKVVEQSVINLTSINNKIGLDKYLEINNKELSNTVDKDTSLILFCEKIITYLYYFVVIILLYKKEFDISLLIVMTSITFVYSNKAYKLLETTYSLVYLTKEIRIFNNLKIVKKENEVNYENIVITVKDRETKSKWIRTKDLNNILINHLPINKKSAFDTGVGVVNNESISNNLFNFGSNQGLENFNVINKYLKLLDIDLSLSIDLLNLEQKDLISACSALFTNKYIVLLKRLEYDWYLELENNLKKALKNKVVIVYG